MGTGKFIRVSAIDTGMQYEVLKQWGGVVKEGAFMNAQSLALAMDSGTVQPGSVLRDEKGHDWVMYRHSDYDVCLMRATPRLVSELDRLVGPVRQPVWTLGTRGHSYEILIASLGRLLPVN